MFWPYHTHRCRNEMYFETAIIRWSWRGCVLSRLHRLQPVFAIELLYVRIEWRFVACYCIQILQGAKSWWASMLWKCVIGFWKKLRWSADQLNPQWVKVKSARQQIAELTLEMEKAPTKFGVGYYYINPIKERRGHTYRLHLLKENFPAVIVTRVRCVLFPKQAIRVQSYQCHSTHWTHKSPSFLHHICQLVQLQNDFPNNGMTVQISQSPLYAYNLLVPGFNFNMHFVPWLSVVKTYGLDTTQWCALRSRHIHAVTAFSSKREVSLPIDGKTYLHASVCIRVLLTHKLELQIHCVPNTLHWRVSSMEETKASLLPRCVDLQEDALPKLLLWRSQAFKKQNLPTQGQKLFMTCKSRITQNAIVVSCLS